MDLFDFLNQDQSWMPKTGALIQISEMDHVWRKNAARWLLRHASTLRQEYRMIEFARRGSKIKPLHELLEEVSKPDQWMIELPLYKSLTSDLPADPRDEFYWATRKTA